MTVETTLSKKIYQGNGVVREFPVPFRVVDEKSLHLLVTDEDNHETPVVNDFVVRMHGGQAETVTYPVSGEPLPLGKRLTLYRRVPRTQPVDLTNAGAFHPDELERMGFDRIVMMVQELQEQTDRAVAVQISEEGKTPNELLDGIYKAAADATTANEESKVVLEGAKAAAGDVVEASERVQEAARKVEEVADKTTEMAARIGPLPAGTELLWPGKTPPVGWIDASLNHGPLLRNTETWGPLWQFAESSGNIIAEDAWQAEVARLGFCAAYSYGDGETTFRAPLLRRAFARAADPETGLMVGAGHGDAIRNITGSIGKIRSLLNNGWSASGAFGRIQDVVSGDANNGSALTQHFYFDASRVVPTAEENRPVGYVRLPIIKVFDTVYQPGTVEIQDLMNQLGAVANLVNSPKHVQKMAGTLHYKTQPMNFTTNGVLSVTHNLGLTEKQLERIHITMDARVTVFTNGWDVGDIIENCLGAYYDGALVGYFNPAIVYKSCNSLQLVVGNPQAPIKTGGWTRMVGLDPTKAQVIVNLWY